MSEIVPFSEWGRGIYPAGAPSSIPIRQETKYLHHGATGTSTVATARAYTKYHIEKRGWLTVGYSWLIADGKVLEGRGPGRAGAHTEGMNSRSYGICMVGNYTKQLPHDRDLAALIWLLRHGKRQGWWTEARLTGGHRQAPGATTTCPGSALLAHIPQINQISATPIFLVPEGTDMEDEDRAVLHDVSAKLDVVIDRIGHRPGFTSLANDHGRERRGIRALLDHFDIDAGDDGP